MTSDRFGEIRIKPDAEKVPQNHRDGESDKRKKETVLPPGSQEQAEYHNIDVRESPGRGLPFGPGRILPWIAVPLFLALLYGVGSYFLIPSLVKGPLSKNISESLGRPVTVGRAIFSPFTWRVFLKNVAVGTAYGDLDKQNLLECDEFHCRIDFLELFNRQLVCHEVRINGVAFNLLRLPLGSFSMEDAANFFSLIKGRKGQIMWPEWLILDGLLLTDGKIIVNDSLTRKQHMIEQIRFYLPSTRESLTGDDASPRLNAVINSSPVQVDGRRHKNKHGAMETRFALRFSGIVLKNYLDYMPVIQQNPFHLVEGQADINVDLVIPDLRSEENRVNIQLDAKIKALQYANKNGQPVLKVPETRLHVRAVPSRNRYLIQEAELAGPEFTLNLNNKQDQNQQGVTFAEINNFLMGLDQYHHGIGIEKLTFGDGKLNVLRDGQKTPQFMWDNCQLHLSGLMNQSARQNDQSSPSQAVVRLSAREKNDAESSQLKFTGKIQAPLQFQGTLSLRSFDLKKYRVQLPRGIQFAGGNADMEGNLLYTVGAGEIKKSGSDRAMMDNGNLTIKDFSLVRDGHSVLAGGELACRKMQVDFSAHQIWCENISLIKNRIDGDRTSLTYLADAVPGEGQWAIRGQRLTVNDSVLLKRLANPFVEDKDVALTFKKFSLDADNLQSEDPAGNTFKMSAVIGEKGNVSLDGNYSPAAGRGRLQVKLDGIELLGVAEYISPWFKPQIEGGWIDAEGIYRVEDQQFTGSVSVKKLQSGKDTEPSLVWQEAVTDNLFIKMAPFTLECAEISVTRPVVSFGISHAEKPLTLFLQPVKFKNAEDSVSIHKIRFTEGTFQMPEPVIFQGYQPELSGLTGTVSPVGKDSMNFFLKGALEEQGSFSVNGTTGMESIAEYALEVSGVPLAPFRSFFSNSLGLDVSSATGSWKQHMRKTDGNYRLENSINLHNVVPLPGGAYFKILALYTDEENSINLTDGNVYQGKNEVQFLFDLFVRRMKHDAVRTDLSEQLILRKLLPELNLQGLVQFVPGSSTPVVSKDLADYELLLSRRPYLRLLLVGQFDPQKDAESLKNSLQQEEDTRREAENRRRAEERRQLSELEKKRLAELRDDSKKVTEERISPMELAEGLQPLPYREVEVTPAMLIEIARRRTAVLHDFFINGLLLPPDRVQLSGDTGQAGPEVHVLVQPYYPETAEKMEDGENDTSVN